MLPFIDIHTHFQNRNADCIAVLNYTQNDFKGENTEGGYPPLPFDQSYKHSIGLHPWFLTKENFSADFEKMQQLIENENVIAIGECGLDRLKGGNLAFQTAAFAAQIRLAESVTKPVIIHCVKAYNELMVLKKQLKPKVPLIIHGFNQNETILKDCLKNGFYLSIGAAILRGDSPASKALVQIPSDHLFFETDVKNIPIAAIYEKAAKILKQDTDALKYPIWENFKHILTYNKIS